MPELEAEIREGIIADIKVCRGAPCGATWEAVKRVIGIAAEDAAARIGLVTQFFCTADSANWDPVHGKSPLHYAGELHSRALERAVGRFYH
jgi:hypothetical protein